MNGDLFSSLVFATVAHSARISLASSFCDEADEKPTFTRGMAWLSARAAVGGCGWVWCSNERRDDRRGPSMSFGPRFYPTDLFWCGIVVGSCPPGLG